MKIYNKDKTQLLTNVDEKYGYLLNDKIIAKVSPEIKEQSHYEYKEYENGGRDRIKVIDVEYKPETIEYEDIKVFIPYTIQELNALEIEKLKNWFNTTYTKDEQKYRRLYTLATNEEEKSKHYVTLINLYKDAEVVRARIQELGG